MCVKGKVCVCYPKTHTGQSLRSRIALISFVGSSYTPREMFKMCVSSLSVLFGVFNVSVFLSLTLSGQNGSSARLSLSSNYTNDLIQMKDIPLHPSDVEPDESRLTAGTEPTLFTGSVC